MCFEVQPEPGRRSLQWSLDVEHCAIARLSVRLVLTLAGARGCTSTPTCSVDVKAEDAEQGEELAYCHSGLYFHSPASSHVEWLGRSGHRAVHERVRGQRCVAVQGCGEDSGKDVGGSLDDFAPRTVAETLLGISVAIFQLFGAGVVHLQALDDGSERLVNFYLGLGFVEKSRSCKKRTGQPKDGQTVSMEGPVLSLIEQLVPTGSQAAAWLATLLPRSFDAKGWLREGIQQLWLERLRSGTLPRFEWRVAWPPRSMLDVWVYRFVANVNSPSSESVAGPDHDEEGFIMDVSMKGVQENELVYGYGMAFPQLHLLSMIWLGRTDSRPTAALVRGQAAYDTRSGVHVTAAVALMGLMAAVALWFGIVRVELRVPEHGCGKLISYLRTLGFRSPGLRQLRPKSSAVEVEASGAREDWWTATTTPLADELCMKESSDDLSTQACGGIRHELLQVSCEALAYRCCPPEWHARVLVAEDGNRSLDPAPPVHAETHQVAVRSSLLSAARCAGN